VRFFAKHASEQVTGLAEEELPYDKSGRDGGRMQEGTSDPHKEWAMMRRSLYLSPAFSHASEIEAFRRAHDPLALKIPPHVTLVFPFPSSLGREELAAHAGEAAALTGCFRIALGRPQIRREYIWLPVIQGGDAITALHDTLYRGLLNQHLDSSRPYEPHVTIARVSESDLDSVYRLALALRGPYEAQVDRLFIELILPDESSKIEEVIEFEKTEADPTVSANDLHARASHGHDSRDAGTGQE